jgi:hypothetical protein
MPKELDQALLLATSVWADEKRKHPRVTEVGACIGHYVWEMIQGLPSEQDVQIFLAAYTAAQQKAEHLKKGGMIS